MSLFKSIVGYNFIRVYTISKKKEEDPMLTDQFTVKKLPCPVFLCLTTYIKIINKNKLSF